MWCVDSLITLHYILSGKQLFRANSMKILEQLIIEGIYEKLTEVSNDQKC